MSGLSIDQLEELQATMVPKPPFLDDLIAEKKAHAKLRAEITKLWNDTTDFLKREMIVTKEDFENVLGGVSEEEYGELKVHFDVAQSLREILEGDDV